MRGKCLIIQYFIRVGRQKKGITPGVGEEPRRSHAFFLGLLIASYPFTPEATILCFSCLENRMDNRITGAMVTTESPMMAVCFVPILVALW